MTGFATPPRVDADLSSCDREPIHIPGAIQPHGVLLGVCPQSFLITEVAGDTERYFGRPPRALLGATLETLLDAEQVSRLKDLLASVEPASRPTRAFNLQPPGGLQKLEVTAHISSGRLILEFEPNDQPHDVDFLTVVQEMIRKIQPASSAAASLSVIVENVREVSGFDRVMVYRFLQDGTGVVDAEARRHDLSPYLGLHYPAADIPKQARDLYLRNWIRLIPDVQYVSSPIASVSAETQTPMDLSHSMLRSVSPVHLEYLTNMGVAASMSLSIIMSGKLWGLIACHHMTPRHLPHRLRVALELFAQMASFLLETKISGEELSSRLQRKTVHEALVSRLTMDADLATELTRSDPNLMDYIPSGGVGVWLDGNFHTIGVTPGRANVAELVEWLNGTVADGVYETHCLSAAYPPAIFFAGEASGLLALSISKTPRDYVLWFRPEFVREVNWAGNPDDKPVKVVDDGLRLSPRKSFALWTSQVRLQSRPWENADVQTAQALRVSLLEVVLKRIDQVARERERARIRQEELMAELDHRMKQWEATADELRREGDRRAVVETELSMVLRRTVLDQEAERRRIARELHDSLGQYLTIMQLDLDSIARQVGDSGEIHERVLKLKQLTAGVGHEVNRLAWAIRPTALDDLGLQTAVQQFLEEWSETSSLKFDLHLTLSDRRLPPNIETALYRTVQEAVTNVVKHADATKVGIILEAAEKEVRLIIEDNGKGFHWGDQEVSPAPTVRLGLIGIRERLSLVGGTLEVETSPGQGTTLIIHVPI